MLQTNKQKEKTKQQTMLTTGRFTNSTTRYSNNILLFAVRVAELWRHFPLTCISLALFLNRLIRK